MAGTLRTNESSGKSEYSDKAVAQGLIEGRQRCGLGGEAALQGARHACDRAHRDGRASGEAHIPSLRDRVPLFGVVRDGGQRGSRNDVEEGARNPWARGLNERAGGRV